MHTTTQPGDVVIVHVDEKPSFYARVEEILPDVKTGWRQIRFRVLTLPAQDLRWILEPCQIDGDPFTMGGTPIRIERLPPPIPEPSADSEESAEPAAPTGPGKVISFPGNNET